ncbi:MAG: hypothetical protein JSV10_00555 [Candidatus Zixiibacteriota bacterium]|nr:MAG: hypothetical protein JSV10_00555 [candidate division Zixibacteria bacterium]
MNSKILLALAVGSLLLGCSQRIVGPAGEDELEFQMVNCDDADEFFQGLEGSFTKGPGYYACACQDIESGTEVLITLTLPYAARFRVEIKNGTGYELRTYDQMGTSGVNVIRWDMKSKKGKTVEPGFYIVRLVAFLDEGQIISNMFMILE